MSKQGILDTEERIVLTPKGKTSDSTILCIERKTPDSILYGEKVFVAGGHHRGIIVNKKDFDNATTTVSSPHVSLEFRVFLVNSQNGSQIQEERTIKFWFRSEIKSDVERANIAHEFFGTLIHPPRFPRDYVGFIKKIMKLLQEDFFGIIKIELILRQQECPKIFKGPASANADFEPDAKINPTEEKIIEIMESLYPNIITPEVLVREYEWNEREVNDVLHRLETKGEVKQIERGAFTRVVKGHEKIKIVKRMPKMVRSHQPSVAVITAEFSEKLALDAMMDNKETFVRYTTVGESNVYTLGNIGSRRVVCTKLPSLGRTREAMTAAGNATTRLLGTFQNVEHVILVGVGGGVPHFTDYNKHVRLGDVVVSYSFSKSGALYVSCDGVKEISEKVFSFQNKEYASINLVLQKIAAEIKQNSAKETDAFWKYIDDGFSVLEKETNHDFRRPNGEGDKIYVAIAERELIEVQHPAPQNGGTKRAESRPRLHLGLIGAGRDVTESDFYRHKFSQAHRILAYVPAFDAVIESIIGNCRESFIFVRGISDYKDGSTKTRWQPYAALAAAAVTKVIISALNSAAP